MTIMSWWRGLIKGYGPGVAVGVGVALMAPVLFTVVASVVRPVAKGVIKGGLMLADSTKEFAAEASEQISDLVAEAKSEYYG